MAREVTKTTTKKIRKIKCTQCFKSVSVPSRMVIYNFLNNTDSGATVTEIVKQVNLTQPTVSYHLKEMKNSGLLDSHRNGKEVHYFVNADCPYCNKECVLHTLEFPEE
jgi:ArsR family transcriptional regulator, lead/cadmium/zinc/bismuth-responsive transcriptional repressor